jgi:deazaflavin-dependent oxidoreductase (nitroreductase family)
MPADFLYLTTIGRRSRLPREIEIWFTQLDGRYYVIAEYEDSDWVQNLKAEPQVRWRIGGQEFNGKARIVEARLEPDLHQKIRKLSEDKYGWGGGLVVELSNGAPEETHSSSG